MDHDSREQMTAKSNDPIRQTQIIKTDTTNERAVNRKARVRRMKRSIIAIVTILLLTPTICCTFLFTKVSYLEKKLSTLEQKQSELLEILTKGEITLKSTYEEEEYSTHLNESSMTENGYLSGTIYNDDDDDDDDENESRQEEETDTKDIANTTDETKDSTDTKDNKEAKRVYLTFDDGPSEYTDQILDILAANEVKATFFVIGREDEESKRLYKRIVDEGHTIGMHSYSHQYDTIYRSLKAFQKDLTKIRDLIYDTTGVLTNYYRFPGGSSNTVSSQDMKVFIQYLNEQGITYFDWNVMNGDAVKEKISISKLENNVIDGVSKFNHSMVLMHDTSTKENTVKSLETIIQTLKKNRYDILPIDDSVEPIQHVKAND